MQLISKSRFVILTLISAFLSIVFIVVDTNENGKQINSIIRSEAASILSTVSSSVKNTIIATNRTENEIIERLINSAWIVSENKSISPTLLQNYANQLKLQLIIISDEAGNISNSSIPMQNSRLPDYFAEQIAQITRNHYQWAEIGLVNEFNGFSNLYILAYNDFKLHRIIFLALDATKFSLYRQEFGIGRQLKDLSANPDIQYIYLKDTLGQFIAKSNSAIPPSDERNAFSIADTLRPDGFDTIILQLGVNPARFNLINNAANLRTIVIGVAFFASYLLIFAGINYRNSIKKLEKSSNAIKNYNDLILNNINDAIIGIDEHQNIIIANNSALNLLHNFKILTLNQPYLQYFEQDLFNIESKNPHNQGETILNCSNSKLDIRFYIKNLRNEDNTEVKIIFFRDITQENQMQMELRRRDQAVASATLAAGVAHEIRNPLNAINIIAQRLEIEFIPQQDAEEYNSLVAIVRQEIARLNQIIKQFLEFSRPAPLNLTNTNANQYFQSLIDFIAKGFASKNIQIQSILNINASIHIKIDQDKFRQVIINLCKNSIEAINESNRAENGLILINISQDERKILIKIEDNGVGISENDLAKIYNLYFTNKKQGSGLGLSLVHQIISEHNASIHCTSQPNVGTSFLISLNIDHI